MCLGGGERGGVGAVCADLQFEAHVLFLLADEVEDADGDLHLAAVDPIDEQPGHTRTDTVTFEGKEGSFDFAIQSCNAQLHNL